MLEMCAPCGQIVNLYQVFETSTEMILLLELAPGGELQALLDRDELIDENTARRFLRQILDGLQYLHAFGVVHLDIKVCVFWGCGGAGTLLVFVIFGFLLFLFGFFFF